MCDLYCNNLVELAVGAAMRLAGIPDKKCREWKQIKSEFKMPFFKVHSSALYHYCLLELYFHELN